MEWSDEAIVLSVRPLGETSVIVDALTRDHGRHAGLVYGGSSRKRRSMLQPGNTLRVQWRARLSEQLGSFTVEPAVSRAGDILESREGLIGLNGFVSLALAALPERELHADVFEASVILLDAIRDDGFRHWGALFVRWETGLLEALGFGLDLSRCVATGQREDLCYVSPKSGCAVSGAAGEPYRERLLTLPAFLLGSQNAEPAAEDILAGLELTGHFLQERVFKPHDRELPQARARLAELAARESG